ncbi:hypothetical protein SK128_018330 [Halocaridina rubra]|uniref:Uncharacterized protein n=1 Tax=Halocaridina rubra TaxID=373956 RepID=A0AAN8X4A4_HALRR
MENLRPTIHHVRYLRVTVIHLDILGRETWRAFKSKLKINMIGLLREPAAIVFLIVFPVVFLVVSILLADMQEFSKPTDVILALNPWTYGNNDALLYNNTGYDLAAIEAVFASDNVTLDSYNGSYSQLYELRPHMSAWYIDDFPDLDM